MYIKPWNKESEQILRKLMKDRVAIINDAHITHLFGIKYKELTKDFFAIGKIKKTNESIIGLREHVHIIPRNIPSSKTSHFPKFELFKYL